MRRTIEDPAELAYYLAYGPKETPVSELIRIVGRRWQVVEEDSFEAAKSEVGLDEEYEVSKWEGWPEAHNALPLSARLPCGSAFGSRG